MKKIDLEATERVIRDAMAKLAVDPKMQHPFGRLQTNNYAIDAHVALSMWCSTLTEDLEESAIFQAAASIIASFCDNLLADIQDDDARHQALHILMSGTSQFAHEMLGFTDGELTGNIADVDIVMKDVGDA